jgi:DNA-binding transcriptional ArsR family regulator
VDVLSITLRALADPSRRTQLMRLTAGRASSGQLAELLRMSRPAGSQHLSVLVDAGLVNTTPAGRQRWHELRLDHLYALRDWLAELISAAETAASTQVAASDPAAPLR